MICEGCGNELNGNYIEFNGKCFCRTDNDDCIKNWLYDRVVNTCRYGTVLNGEKIDLTKTRPVNTQYIAVRNKAALALNEACKKYELDNTEVLSDLIDDFLEELVSEYNIKPKETEEKEIAPSFSEIYLNTLGMSMNDFL